MEFPIYQVDAFTGSPFGGNPAAVVPLVEWLPDATLQAIAAENNLSETAFLIPRGDDWDLRWFTPRIEVDLCGHATLASARVVLDHLKPGATEVRFRTRSGELVVSAGQSTTLRMDFPATPPTACDLPAGLPLAMGRTPLEVHRSPTMYLAVYESEAHVRDIVPERAELMKLDRLGVIATAPADDPGVDFISRFFAPKAGVLEDPVTGSAHCVSTPYWARRLSRSKLRARQVSERGGELLCEDRGDRIWISGEAVTYLEGQITIGDG